MVLRKIWPEDLLRTKYVADYVQIARFFATDHSERTSTGWEPVCRIGSRAYSTHYF